MRLADVMDDIAAALQTIHGLRVYPFIVDKVNVPAAVVTWPDSIVYDAAMGRGGDRMTLPVLVLVSRADQRSARDLLAAYLDGAGPRSVKAAVEGHTATSYDSARVMTATPGGATSGGQDYLGAVFDIDIIGKGSS